MYIGIIKYKCACIVNVLEPRKRLIKMLVTDCHVDMRVIITMTKI